MAPPRRSRRPRTTLLILVLASVTIITLDARGGFDRITSGVKSVAADAFAPVRSGVDDVIEPIGSFLAGSVHYGAVRQQNQKLQAEIYQLKNQQGSAADNEQAVRDAVSTQVETGRKPNIKTALKKHEVDSMKPLDEATELQILGTLIKQRREAADMFRKGGRAELAEKEEAELKLIESYMPSAPSDQEIEAAIAEAMAETGATSAKQMGLVMKSAQAKLTGKRVDGKALSEKVRARLS